MNKYVGRGVSIDRYRYGLDTFGYLHSVGIYMSAAEYSMMPELFGWCEAGNCVVL